MDPHSYRITIEQEDLDLIKQMDIHSVLEVCCGDGANAIYFAKGGYQVTGIESNGKLISKAIVGDSDKKVTWIQHPIYYDRLPFTDGSFDFVYSYQYLNHNFKDEIERVFKEIHRILRKGGLFSLKISDIDQFNLIHVRDEIYKEGDKEHLPIRYRKLAEQTYAKIEEHEVWIPHYAFSHDELVESLERSGFEIIRVRTIRWNFVANVRKI